MDGCRECFSSVNPYFFYGNHESQCRDLTLCLKITQDNPRSTWAKVPLQDFTPQSDIDWTAPIANIDRQLYAKYALDSREVEFIESKVRGME